MKVEELKIYQQLKIYDRYKFIVVNNQSQKRLEKPDRVEVEYLINELGYQSKYYNKENLFQIRETNSNIDFIFNIILRHVRIEPVFFANSKVDGTKIGSVLMRICKQLDMEKGIERPESIGAATFSSYKELKKILSDLLDLYEDFKREVSLIWLEIGSAKED